MRMRMLITAIALAAGMPAQAYQGYGGGWATPSLDTMVSVTNEIGNRSVMQDIIRQDVARGGSRRMAAPGRPGAFLPPAATGAPGPMPAIETRFQRSPAVEKKSQADILAVIQKRQPEAAAHYRQLFARADMPRAFEEVTKGYGMRADDAADAVTSYWVMAWVVANQAPLPSPASVRAARRQVVMGFAHTDVGSYDPRRRQMLADEAIFNFLVLNQSWRNAMQGRDGSLDELGNATQRNFLPLGADLRSLVLGPDGFARR